MGRTVKCGLIQATHAGPTDAPIEDIKRANIDNDILGSQHWLYCLWDVASALLRHVSA